MKLSVILPGSLVLAVAALAAPSVPARQATTPASSVSRARANAPEHAVPPTTAPAPTAPTLPRAQGPLVLKPAADGNTVSYHVREQLLHISFPTDAVGQTNAITGQLVMNPDGVIDTAQSKFTVDLTTLKSDRDMRDHFIQRNTLETAQYPSAVLVLRKITGLPSPLPDSGRFTFTMTADLTVHGVTRPTTWEGDAEARDGAYTGTASTHFTFDDFGLTRPRVRSVLSVENNIGLMYQFKLVPEGAAAGS
jgi:polyisoprenoid-binding protein YceI